MQTRIWSLILLLFVAITLATCFPGSQTANLPEPSPPSAQSPIPTPSAGTPSLKDEECKPNYYELQENPQLNCAVVFNYKSGGIRIDSKTQGSSTRKVKLLPGNLLEAVSSWADLVFNELSFAKAQPGTEFAFKSGQRRKNLSSNLDVQANVTLAKGKALFSDVSYSTSNETNSAALVSPEIDFVSSQQESIENVVYVTPHNITQQNTSSSSPFILRLDTKEMKIDSQGAVYLIQRDAQKKRSQVYSLTQRSITVFDNRGKIVILRGNQTVIATESGLEEPSEFRLCSLYRTEEILKGLAPGEEDIVREKPKVLQSAYWAARSETLPLYYKLCQRRCPPRGSGE